MCLFGIVERPVVSWGVLGCPGVIRLTPPRLVGTWSTRPGQLGLLVYSLGVPVLMC